MNSKHRKILKAVFKDPVSPSIVWKDIESMLSHIGAYIEEREGSRICIQLNNTIAVFHRPHPRKETDKVAIKSLRKFLIAGGINDA